MNLFHYVKQYGNCSFQEEPFNEIDNVIFSQLSYLPFEKVVGTDFEKISLKDSMEIIAVQEKLDNFPLKARFYKKVYRLFKIMATSRRYQDVMMSHYVKVVDHNCQFGALTLTLPDKTIYVSFEGTDTAISGWKEDATMTYQFPVPAQELAALYLRRFFRFGTKKIRIGGHSKGGNLAIYAAMKAPFYIQKRIIAIYSNDGPGFLKEEILNRKYQKITKKIHKIVPKESIVGMLLYQPEEITIVKSKSKRIFQHDPFSWQCRGTSFETDELSLYSKKVREKINDWIDHLDREDRQKCVEDFFQIFDKVDAIDTHDLFSVAKTLGVVKEVRNLNDNSKKNLLEVLKAIV